jgi:hypothetical protein
MLAAARERIAAHPWRAVAMAALAGAWFALEDKRVRRREIADALRAWLVRSGRRFVEQGPDVPWIH